MIIVRLSGGMGNQMFQYACGRALSLKYSVPLALDCRFLNEIDRVRMPLLRPHFTPRDYALDVFCIDANIADREEIPLFGRPFLRGKIAVLFDALLRKVPILPGWEKTFRYDERIVSLGPNAYLAGFWQSKKYFSAIEPVIRADFKLKNPLPEKTQMLFTEISSADSVCVHVRRTDMAANAFHGTADTDYYARGIEYIAKNNSIEKIYVFSDDIDWAKNNLTFSYPAEFVNAAYSGAKGEGHLALMSACKHFVIPNSTFSWWAAWLGAHADKVVIAPKRWFGNSSIDTTDLIPENWIRL
jgi:hypothetical protein